MFCSNAPNQQRCTPDTFCSTVPAHGIEISADAQKCSSHHLIRPVLMYATHFLQLWLTVWSLLICCRVWNELLHWLSSDQQLFLAAHCKNLIKFNLSEGTKRKAEVKIRFYSLSEALCNSPKFGICLVLRLITLWLTLAACNTHTQ